MRMRAWEGVLAGRPYACALTTVSMTIMISRGHGLRRCSRSFASSFSFSITFVWCVTALSSSIIFEESRSSLSLASFLSLSTQRESVSTFCTRGCRRSLTQVLFCLFFLLETQQADCLITGNPVYKEVIQNVRRRKIIQTK